MILKKKSDIESKFQLLIYFIVINELRNET